MSPFRFSLQRVLELREKKQQAMAQQLAAAQAEAEAARIAREALEQVRTAGRDRLVEAHGRRQSVGELRQMGFVLEALDTRVAQARTTHAAAEQAANVAQERLAQAYRDRRVIDRLREKQQDAWRTDAVREDLAAMNDIALTRFAQDAAQRASDAAGAAGTASADASADASTTTNTEHAATRGEDD